MFTRLAVACLAVAFSVAPALASPTNDLLRAVGVDEIISLMREEGLAHGDELAADMWVTGPNAAWNRTVSRIYDEAAMLKVVEDGFEEAFGDTDPSPLLEFFTSEDGRNIVTLELEARRAMIDEEIEESARDAYRALRAEENPRLDILDDFVEANDLVDSNVVGALNSRYMFMRGLIEGGGIEMTEEDMLASVWSQEGEMRTDTANWLYAYLVMAYGPLDDEVVEAYVALSQTPEGNAMNNALFAGFDEMYAKVSYALGLAAAEQMQAQDL